MVREFTLVDGNGEEYSLTNEEHLLFDPSGLGFERENTYRQVGNRFILANSVPTQSVIEGTVCFTPPDAYFNYQEFVEFCGRDGLKMEYRLSEMPSRKTKRLTGNVVWTDFAGNQYAGMYNFITGDYLLTEKIIECDANTVANVEATFDGGASTLYSIPIVDYRNITELTYCNGVPASTADVTNLNVGSTNRTRTGGNVNKIYFSLHNDALQGKTINQWFAEHNVKFSYTLNEPISGNNATYKFNPKLMYNPMVNFISINAGSTKIPSIGNLSYIDTNEETIYLEGDNLILENTELNQELESLIVFRKIDNKNIDSRFEFVGTNLVSSTNLINLRVGNNNIIELVNTQEGHIGVSYVYSTLPIGYMSKGVYTIEFDNTIRIMTSYGINPSAIPVMGSPLYVIYVTPILVKDNGDNTYTEIIRFNHKKKQIIFTGTSFIYDTYDCVFNISKTFSKEVNSTIYLKIDIDVDIMRPAFTSVSGYISYCKFNSCSLRANNIGYGPVKISDLKVSSEQSIAQVSQADSQHYQRAIRLNKIEKTELTKSATLETEVEFECLEPWGDPFSANVEHGTSPDPVNSISINSDSHSLSPCDLYISGPCTNPTWVQTVDGKEITTGGYTGTIASGERLMIRAKDGACGIYLVNANDEVTDVYKNSDFSKDRFVYIRYGNNVITVTDGADGTNQLDCYIEGDLYYESV